MNENIRVVIADDQRVVREGLNTLLGLIDDVEVVGLAADGEEAVKVALSGGVDVVMMDLRMPRCDGVEATRRLTAEAPLIKVLVLTTYADDRSVIDALRAGARGYLTKDAGVDEISKALRQLVQGRAAIDPAVQHHLLEALGSAPAAQDDSTPSGLTTREAEVLTLIARGFTNRQIAEQLFVNESTIKTHINHLFSKLGVQDRAQAVALAYRHGIT